MSMFFVNFGLGRAVLVVEGKAKCPLALGQGTSK